MHNPQPSSFWIDKTKWVQNAECRLRIYKVYHSIILYRPLPAKSWLLSPIVVNPMKYWNLRSFYTLNLFFFYSSFEWLIVTNKIQYRWGFVVCLERRHMLLLPESTPELLNWWNASNVCQLGSYWLGFGVKTIYLHIGVDIKRSILLFTCMFEWT